MPVNPTLLSLLSALLGALVGGGASMMTALYVRRCQERLHRAACEVAKREMVYADFVTSASHLLFDADAKQEIASSSSEQRLIGLINRMRLFAPLNVVRGAEGVLRATVEITPQPSVRFHRLAKQTLFARREPDPLLTFSAICRADLEAVRRTAA